MVCISQAKCLKFQQIRSVSLNSRRESNAHFIKRKNKNKQTRHINIKQIKIKLFLTFN